MKKQVKIQLTLISIGLALFALTYLFYPIIKNKDKILKDEFVSKDFEKIKDGKEITTFENLEYKGIYDLDKPFTVQSEEAYILTEEPDIVYMKNMRVLLHLKSDRTVEITSLTGRYNKVNYNCYFEEDVLVTDGATIITATNLDLLATKNSAEIYNDVSLDYTTGFLTADKIDYDFDTKHFKVSMFDDKTIKMRVIR